MTYFCAHDQCLSSPSSQRQVLLFMPHPVVLLAALCEKRSEPFLTDRPNVAVVNVVSVVPNRALAARGRCVRKAQRAVLRPLECGRGFEPGLGRPQPLRNKPKGPYESTFCRVIYRFCLEHVDGRNRRGLLASAGGCLIQEEQHDKKSRKAAK